MTNICNSNKTIVDKASPRLSIFPAAAQTRHAKSAAWNGLLPAPRPIVRPGRSAYVRSLPRPCVLRHCARDPSSACRSVAWSILPNSFLRARDANLARPARSHYRYWLSGGRRCIAMSARHGRLRLAQFLVDAGFDYRFVWERQSDDSSCIEDA